MAGSQAEMSLHPAHTRDKAAAAPGPTMEREIDENDNSIPWGLLHHTELSKMLQAGLGKTMVIDSRSFLEYNTSNIQQSINVCCSKLVKRRLQQDKVHILDLIQSTCNVGADASWDVVVYDQCTEEPSQLTADNFVHILLRKLSLFFNSVAFLKGGFLQFQASHSALIEHKSSSYRCSTLTSLSQPCMPVSNVGPTRILPFLYLGSQQDSINHELAQVNGISYILNVSKTCPRPPYIQDGHFHRISVNDNYCERLLPHFQEAFQFLDKVREANGCALVHCLGGVSRSATLAIAYIMKHMKMSSDEAYRYVKDKRPTISPNFNFLGQLLEFEKILRREEQEAAVRSQVYRGSPCEQDKASPVMMDLHTTSPSSPGPRSANKTFVLESISSAAFSPLMQMPSKSSHLGCYHTPTGPANLSLRKTSREIALLNSALSEDTILKLREGLPSELLYLTEPVSETSCPFPGPGTESVSPFPGPESEPVCPFPGPDQQQTYSKTELNTSCNSSSLPYTGDEVVETRLHPTVCVKASTPAALQASVCPMTGFPSPTSIGSASVTGFPGPQSECVVSDSVPPHSSGSTGDLSCDSVETKYTYQSSLTQMASSTVTSDLTPTSKPPVQKSKHSFSFASMLSSFRRKPRPPTLPLSSPGGAKDLSHSPAEKRRTQLTPVSEASESCDPLSEESSPTREDAGVANFSSQRQEIVMDQQDSENVSQTLSQCSSSSNANNVSMASTQNNLYSSSLFSSKELVSNVQKTDSKSFVLQLDQQHSSSAISVTSKEVDSQMGFLSSSLSSPGDSNKRKGEGYLHSFTSPDKLAKTELSLSFEGKHASSSKLSPPRTLNLASPGQSTSRHRQHMAARRPLALTLTSPTAAMARLNFASPSDPVKDFSPAGPSQSEGRPLAMTQSNPDIFPSTSRVQKVPLRSKSKNYGKGKHRLELNVEKVRQDGKCYSSYSNTISLERQTDSSLSSPSDGSLSSSISSSSGSSKSHSSRSSMWKSSSSSRGMSSSFHSETSSSTSSPSSRGLRGLGDFPTTSLDKLSFTPCSVRDIVQELKNEEMALLGPGSEMDPLLQSSEAGSSALDSPMSISSGSSAPSLASSTLSPLDSGMSNPFSDRAATSDVAQSGPSLSAFNLSSAEPSLTPHTSTKTESSSEVTSPSTDLMSPTSLPQATVAPKTPTVTSPFYSSCSSVEPLSPMSLSDSSSSSPIRSPMSAELSSFSSTLSSPVSSLSSPVTSSSSFPSPLMSSAAYLHSHVKTVSPLLATATAALTSKVVRRRDSKSRREAARPNSIAYSSYPLCDLVCESGETSTSHDDASETYMSAASRRSMPPAPHATPRGRTSWGGYSEREVYRQISAAMESAMMRTRAYTSEECQADPSGTAGVHYRKTRSLDNILDNADVEELHRDSQRKGGRYPRTMYGEQLFETFRCGLRGGSEPYQSSSSLSSNGSHGSIHSSLEIIQGC